MVVVYMNLLSYRSLALSLLLVALLQGSLVRGARASDSAAEAAYGPVAEAAAIRVGLDPLLVQAIIDVESAWRPRAESVDGALGLMQILPATAGDYVDDPDLWDPVVNIGIGVAHLRRLVDQFGVVRALGAWNAGEGALVRSRVFEEFAETRRFVARVLQQLEKRQVAYLGTGDGLGLPDGWLGGVVVLKPLVIVVRP